TQSIFINLHCRNGGQDPNSRHGLCHPISGQKSTTRDRIGRSSQPWSSRCAGKLPVPRGTAKYCSNHCWRGVRGLCPLDPETGGSGGRKRTKKAIGTNHHGCLGIFLRRTW